MSKEYEYNRKPYACPICNGKGTVPNSFYLGTDSAVSTQSVMCRSCNGNGVLWG